MRTRRSIERVIVAGWALLSVGCQTTDPRPFPVQSTRPTGAVQTEKLPGGATRYRGPLGTFPKGFSAGSGIYRFRTDSTGTVVSLSVVKSGGADFDRAVLAFVPGHWKGPPDMTGQIPVSYRLRQPPSQ